MTEATGDLAQWLTRFSHESFAYLTTLGRRSGHPHRIEIWFAVEADRLYPLAGGRDRSDWVHNLQANAHVTVELGGEIRAGVARVLLPGTPEDGRARELRVSKYQRGNDLDVWGRSSLAVVVEFLEGGAESSASSGRQQVS